ncbi:hypothetical protein ACH5RR_022971 [Cinchona calisaya]|uniref:C2 domain-containing protein n=1 Tax=Cinchona calisaya TaxID=153742 RepID=A0ABD2ZAV0_9GENT
MECYPLDITLISAEGLKDVSMFSKMDVYVVVTISGHPKNKNQNKTHVDKNGGTNPKWNHHMKFTIDEASVNNPGISLLIRLKSDSSFGSDKEIGEVNIPIPELFNGGDTNKNSGERVVEYPVRTSSGKAKGNIKFSYKFGEKFTQQVEAKKKNVEEPVSAYPAPAGPSNSMAYPLPYQGYAMPPPGYQQPPGAGGYAPYPPPPHGYGGYPPAGYPPTAAPPGYGYPPPPGYGYPPQPNYGYPPQPYQQVQPPKKNKSKMGLGMGLGAGLLGGLLVGDMMGDVGEMAAYDEGYDDAMGGF